MPPVRVLGRYFDALVDYRDGRRGRLCLRSPPLSKELSDYLTARAATVRRWANKSALTREWRGSPCEHSRDGSRYRVTPPRWAKSSTSSPPITMVPRSLVNRRSSARGVPDRSCRHGGKLNCEINLILPGMVIPYRGSLYLLDRLELA